jgi:YidC/Oxa1 family membrane protein insertase
VQVFFVPKSPVKKADVQREIKKEVDEKISIPEEEFYVLENSFQQLVFSNIGAALVEINLPLKTKENKSIINPTEFDEKLEKDSPQNAYFPQKPYFGPGFVKQKNKLGGYYPLLRRSIYDKTKKILVQVPPKYYALNTVNNNTSTIKFKVTKFEKNSIEFQGSDGSRTITKTYFFDENNTSPYVFNLKIKIDGNVKNLFLTSGICEAELISNRYTPSLKYKTIQDNKTPVKKISLPKALTENKINFVDWISTSNGFFGIIIDPLGEIKAGYETKYIPGSAVPTKLSLIDAKYDLYPPKKYPGYEVNLPLFPGEKTYRIFAGPYQSGILRALDDIYSKPLKGYFPEYIKVKSIKGFFSFASEPFSKFLLIIMRLFYNLTHSWGLSIILLTLVFRIMLFPLNSWSIKSTMKMQEITPLLKIIDAKYKKDPKRANVEKMKLFKEKGTNPLSGCLPILIQLPFLFGMFNLLRTTFELRGVSFIPGWIDNLTSPDILFSWNYPLFFIGTEFHLLPILLGVVMFVQSKMNMKPKKTGEKLTDQQKQQKMMTYLMPVLFVVLFYKAASGLNIYFLFSMFLGILQQLYMSKTKKIAKL